MEILDPEMKDAIDNDVDDSSDYINDTSKAEFILPSTPSKDQFVEEISE